MTYHIERIVPHGELLKSVARRIVDRHVLRLIKLWLKAPIEERDDGDGTRRIGGGKSNARGTPQGGVVSPLLANIYMNRFLKYWRLTGRGEAFRAHVIAYADDFVILSRGCAAEALAWTKAVMMRPSHTRLSPVSVTFGPLKPDIRRPVRYGNVLILIFVVVFVGWGGSVYLDGGAVAPGVINPDSGKKTIQHLEGGIIAELPVHEGQAVKLGQPLVLLESTQARATHEALVQQRLSLLARQARLDAERAGESRIQWPPELRPSDLQIRGIVVAQQKVFDARRSTLATRRDILAQRIEQLLQQIQGSEAQVESASQQMDFIAEELKAKEYLVARGMMPKPEALRLKRAEAEIVGRRGEHLAEIARAREKIGEAKIQILSVEAERADQIATEQDKVRAELAEVNEKLQASADVVKRTEVIAPVNGTVVDIKFRTIGGVVQRGDPIMSIVPESDEMIIEARLQPRDVKAVHSGLEAKVRFTAYSSRNAPDVPGTVRTVSADRLMDETKHQPYYLVRVAVDRELVKTLAPSVNLIPGMPVEVLVVSERRTMLDYLAKPFRDALWRSFRET